MNASATCTVPALTFQITACNLPLNFANIACHRLAPNSLSTLSNAKVHLPTSSALIVVPSVSNTRSHEVILMDSNNIFCCPSMTFTFDKSTSNICTRARANLVCQLRCPGNAPSDHIGLNVKSSLLQHLCDLHLDLESMFHAFSEGKEYNQQLTTHEDNNLQLKVCVKLNTNVTPLEESSNLCLHQLPHIIQYHATMAKQFGIPQVLSIDDMIRDVSKARTERWHAMKSVCEKLFTTDMITWKLTATRMFENLEFDMKQSNDMRHGSVLNNMLIHTHDLITVLGGMVVDIAQQNNILDLDKRKTLQCVLDHIKTTSESDLEIQFERHAKLNTICTTAYCNDPKFEIGFGIDGMSRGTDNEINVRMSLHMNTAKEAGEAQTIHGSWTVGNSVLDQMVGLPVGIRKGDCEDNAAIIAAHIDILQLSDLHTLMENMDIVLASMPEDYQHLKTSIIELGKCMWNAYRDKTDDEFVTLTKENIQKLMQKAANKSQSRKNGGLSAMIAKAPSLANVSYTKESKETTITKSEMKMQNMTAKEYADNWQQQVMSSQKRGTNADSSQTTNHMSGHAAAMKIETKYVGSAMAENGMHVDVNVVTGEPCVLEATAYAEQLLHEWSGKLDVGSHTLLRQHVMQQLQNCELPGSILANIESTVCSKEVEAETGFNTSASQGYHLLTPANSRYLLNSLACFYQTTINLADHCFMTMQMPSSQNKKWYAVTGAPLDRELKLTQTFTLSCSQNQDKKLNLNFEHEKSNLQTLGAIASLFTLTLPQLQKINGYYSPLKTRMQSNSNLKLLNAEELSNDFYGGMIVRGMHTPDLNQRLRLISTAVQNSYKHDRNANLVMRFGPYLNGTIVRKVNKPHD